ncbi:DNA topoisomerase I [Actinobacillus equuli]|nr:DNA topoisomerase I [Actinobacillus equuli]
MLEEVLPSQHFTKPPARSLRLHWLKNWKNVVSVVHQPMLRLFQRFKSVVTCVLKSPFLCRKMGEIVTDRLDESFSDLMNYDFTANMEETLDQIAEGNKIGKRRSIISSRISLSSLPKPN